MSKLNYHTLRKRIKSAISKKEADIEELKKILAELERCERGEDMEPIVWVFIGVAVVMLGIFIAAMLSKKNSNSDSSISKQNEITENDIRAIEIIQDIAGIYKTVDERLAKTKK